MMEGKILIPAQRVSASANAQGVIKISPDAFKALAEVVNESGYSVRRVASEIILQAIEKDLIVFDRGKEE